MTKGLIDFEIDFIKDFRSIDTARRQKAGSLLPIIPNHVKWDDFLATVKTEWWIWERNLGLYPHCLVVLYGGLAFYEYEDNTLWPQFGKAIGSESLSRNANQQREINAAFEKAAQNLELKILQRESRTDYIGSGVYHIGVPLSLWDGFLEICEWALWRDDWKTLSDKEWDDSVGKRASGRQRLKKFLIDNREVASTLIKEMLDARELAKDGTITIHELAEVCTLLRSEYFDEEHDTAEFLRPQNPESLFLDRARLIWDDQRSCIKLRLPSVARSKLPATWSVGELTQEAAATPDELILNSAAFDELLVLKLKSGRQTETQPLQGVKPWGLFDLESGGRLVNSNRDELRLRTYVLISPEKIEDLSRKGFDEEENPVNELIELKDGTTCFITRLWPVGKFAELSLRYQSGISRIRFRTKSKIEAQFFVGKGAHAGSFTRLQDGIMKIEDWPVLCVSIPCGYFKDNQIELDKEFRVLIDDKLAGGNWELIQANDDREFYFWKWIGNRPFVEQIKSGIARNFKELRDYFRSPDLKGNRILSIKSPEFRVKYQIYKDNPKRGMDKCWKNLPGAFLLWFLLCQSDEGMKWEDLILAKDVIAPNLRVSYYLLHKYANQGLLAQNGRRWIIKESRAAFTPLTHDNCRLEYCGDPSILWGLYRLMYHKVQDRQLPIIEVVDKRGVPPFLQMIWNLSLQYEIEKYLKKNDVIVGDKLWIL